MKDHWAKSDTVFICDGQGYVLSPLGQTLCIGLVDENGEKVENPLSGVGICAESAPPCCQDAQEGVSKLPCDINHTPAENQAQTATSFETSKKHSGGRPRKTEDISRVTEWRRRKEIQGALF